MSVDALPIANICIVALTEAGKHLAVQLQPLLPNCRVEFKPKPFAEQLQRFFKAGDRLILICATGIAVRSLAPVLQSKELDPPVLVLDEAGKFVIPLISGHEGGANQFADEVAQLIGAQTVITTARPYLKPVYTVGMGCERNCDSEHLNALLEDCLRQANLPLEQIRCISSIELKANEVGLIHMAAELHLPFICYTADQLAEVEPLLSQRSDYVYKTVGVYGVAESAALLSAKELAALAPSELPELVLAKQKTARATCSIARAFPPLV